MKHEFKVTKSKEQTVYTLESATGGSSSTAGGASVSTALGGVQRRPADSIFAQEEKKEAPKPRNFVAKNAMMGGAGKMKDKSKTIPRHEKHKKPVAEDHEIQMADSELQSIAKNAVHLLDLIKHYSEQEGLQAWQQSKITKAADYLNSVLQSISGEQSGMEEGSGKMRGNPNAYDADVRASQAGMNRSHDHRGLGQELGHETNNYAVDIDGRTWKVFADQRQAQNIAKSLQTKGKNATVHPTGANPTEGIEEDWSQKYKSSINCSHPKGFSQKAHCAGKKKHDESVETEMTCPDCGMCEAHGNSKIYDKCWTGFRKVPGKARGEKGSCKEIGEDAYTMELAAKIAEKLNPKDPTDVWVQDFQKADPNRYHQFKKKTPQKKAQMAVAAHYAANEPSKKK